MIGTSRGYLQTLYDLQHASPPAGWSRIRTGGDGASFVRVEAPQRWTVIASVARELDGRAWLHVSTARTDRVPTWDELVEVKETFAGADSVAYQVIPRRSEYVNDHEFCLHVFVPLEGDDPLPDFTRGSGSI